MLTHINVSAAKTPNPAATSINAVTVCETPEIVGVSREFSCLPISPELQGRECEDNSSSVTSCLCCVPCPMM